MAAQSPVPSIPDGVPKSKAPDPVYARPGKVLGTFSVGSSPLSVRDPTLSPGPAARLDKDRARIRLTIVGIAVVALSISVLYVAGAI
jgi:hypothetical protein